MNASEAQFCRDQAARLLKLARETTDENLRARLTEMAAEWVADAKAYNQPGTSERR